MKRQYGQLLLWHSIFYVLYYTAREVFIDKDFGALTDLFLFQYAYMELTIFICFFLYSLGVYWVMLHHHSKSWWKITLMLIVVVLLSTGFRYSTQEMIAPHFFGFRNYREDYPVLLYFLDNVYYATLHGAIGFTFFYFKFSKYKDRKQQELLIQNKKTELAYLRSQINPHFLFNTLNNIYSLVYQKSDDALRSVEKLTAMLRYGLYEQEEFVPLAQEIKHLHNFIELERMRYDYDLELHLNINESTQEFKVPPFLLIPFVENAFKHGDLRQSLHIDLEVQNQKLHFGIKNAVKSKQKDGVGGIGLENVRKRLELIYGERHDLEVKATDEEFEIQLKIEA
ncbi:MAG: histidine kinase [Bacteroidota bacterium]